MNRTLLYLLLTASFLCSKSTFAQQEGPCSSGAYELVRPFMGNWKEYTLTDSTAVFIGNLKSQLELGGCMITQQFTSSDGAFSYRSFGYVSASANIWEETYVFNNGSYSIYQWMAEGTDILMRRVGGSRLLDYMQQLRLTGLKADQYTVVEEHSFDGGKTWSAVELTRIERVE